MRREVGESDTDVSSAAGGDAPGELEGTPNDWYRRAVALLESGSPDAVATLFVRLREIDPGSNCILEGLSRALFNSRHWGRRPKPSATWPTRAARGTAPTMDWGCAYGA
jgi:hypothetical protein